MKIIVLNEDRIISYKLPDRIEGNFWITNFDDNDIQKNLINIEATEDKKWKILSNRDYYLFSGSTKVDSVIVEEYNFYIVKDSYSEKIFVLYCIPTYENNFKYYSVTSNLSTGLTIGKSTNSIICYNYPLINELALTLKLENEKVYAICNSNDKVYVNNERITKKEIFYGDTIFLMGLEIVLLKIKNNYVLAINNPNDLVSTFLKEEIMESDNIEFGEETDEEKEISLYSENDYFYRKPRFIYSVENFDLEIDSPPAKQEKEEMPAILTIGPMLTMSLTSVVTITQTISNVQSGNQTWEDAKPSLIITGAMMLSLLFWPLLTNFFQKNLNKKKEKNRQIKYSEYLDSQKELIAEEKKNQEEILRKSYTSLQECANIIESKNDRLWERRIQDDDFLSVSLGYGNLPMKINVRVPTEKFSMEEDNLKKKVEELGKCENVLENVPIPYSFSENFITAIIGNKKNNYKLVKNILFQLLTFHSYDNLKIIILSTKNKIGNFDEFKRLPHFFSDDKVIRFFADKNDEYKEIVYYLEKIFNSRKEFASNSSIDDKSFDKKYLIITDSFNSIRNLDLIKNIVEEKSNLGFSLLILNDKISNLPDQCQTFIELSDDQSRLFKNIANNAEQKFNIDYSDINYSKYFKILCNLPIKFDDNSEGIIPKKVGFLEMYEIGKVEQLNCKNRWQENVPLLNMGAIVGIGKNGEKIVLDLHEKYHGPHGLVAGMTGSGKSEFIITYILSMAINYHPHEVQFILIDYKGGGLAGAFENSALGYKLPHLVGVITNLDKTEINRSLASIESELKRRQDLFNKARDKSGESTIDIYKYQKLYREGVVDEPVAHLLIIADEFAELKTQQPEFMEQLISTARIGRSLGVHLILATQKPSGVVDAQIWSNTRFRVCLRVQETGDSSEVIQCPDAAYLTQTGRFYLQVGYNEIFVLGQSAWAGGKYIPSESIKKTIDTTMNFINNIGYVVKNAETKKVKQVVDENNGEELINIVKYLCDSAREEEIICRPLWLDKISEFILIDEVIKKYNYEKEEFILNPVIGEYDIPSMQQQKLLTIPFTTEGNVLLYGMAGSGKENFITSMIYSSMITYSPNELNYYIIDFGAEVLRCFDKCNIVGDILYISDNEKIKNLFKLISDTITERKKLFSEYNGDYISYCKGSGKLIPNIVVIINNYDAFIETYEEYYDILIVLTRDCIKYGIFFMITTNTPDSIRFKLKQNFSQNFVLQQTNEDDYSQILGNTHKLYPSKYFGRGLIKKEDIHEFQTAYVATKDKISEKILQMNEKLKEEYGIISRRVPVLPEIVIYDDIYEETTSPIIGINKYDLRLSTYDFKTYNINTIASNDFSLFEPFINPLLYQFTNDNTIVNIVINCDNIKIDDEITSKVNYFDSNFDSIFNTILNFLNNSVSLYEQNNKDKSVFVNRKKVNCVIIAPSLLKSKLSDENQFMYEQIFTTANDLGVINYTFIDTENKFAEFEYEQWYKNNRNNSNFIWLGSGISDQYSFNTISRVQEHNEEIPYNFCYVVKKGKPEYVKFIEKIHK